MKSRFEKEDDIIQAARRLARFPDGITLEMKPEEERLRTRRMFAAKHKAMSHLRKMVEALYGDEPCEDGVDY